MVANAVLSAADAGSVVNVTTAASALTVTLPASNAGEGDTILVRKIDSGAGSVSVGGQSLTTQYKAVEFVYSATRSTWEPRL